MPRSRFTRLAAAALLLAASAARPQTLNGPSLSNLPAHETLDYSIEWRLVTAGKARFTWTGTPASGQVKLKLDSAGLVSKLYRVDDDYTATVGENLCAQSTVLISHEGKRDRDTRVTFDSPGHRASNLEKDLDTNATSAREVEIPGCVHDVVGALMVLRRTYIEIGKSARIPISDGKKFVEARVDAQRREDLKTAYGPRRTVRYEAFLFDDLLFRRSGHLYLWLTDDEQRLPVQLQVKMNIAIGTITFRLEKEDKL